MTELRVDFEREFLKDYIYLLEENMILDRQIQEEMNDRKPAKIFVIKEKVNEHENTPLPF